MHLFKAANNANIAKRISSNGTDTLSGQTGNSKQLFGCTQCL